MNIVGIIGEYNPFHKGHRYQIEKIKREIKDAYIVALVSGEFVQRGGASLFDKYTKAKISLENGVDLVLKLHPFFSMEVAPIFALGAVKTLDSLNIVDYLCFGSESGSLGNLKFYAREILNNDKENSKSLVKKNNWNLESNDILALEYLKAIYKINSKIQPFLIKRQGNVYNNLDLSGRFASASAIRNALENHEFQRVEKYIPKNSIKYYEENYYKFSEEFFNLIKYKILVSGLKLNKIFEVTEGIENLILKNIKKAKSLNDFINITYSKRYSKSKIRRMAFNILLDIKKSEINSIQFYNFHIPYVRVLGFNEKGRKILKSVKENSSIEVINKVANYKIKSSYSKMFFEKEILEEEIYNVLKESKYSNSFKTSPIIL